MNTLLFLFNSIMMGVGLAMDAFCVSAANGLRCPRMTGKQVLCISSVFAFFQFIMPLIGYICVHLGKAFGTGLKKHANILGGCILIFIGLEIFISSFM